MNIVFENNGVIDKRVIDTFGVSVKDGSNPIGQFGTGLKYSIAVLLREGCSVSVYAGEDIWLFSVEKDTIRGEEFSFIVMEASDGEKKSLGFTTELGKKWELWMAYRELYCNAKDEDGCAYSTSSGVFPEPNKTKIVVQGRAFEEVYANRHRYFIEGSPKWSVGSVQVFDEPSHKVFYQGVLVYETERTCMFTYNFLSGIELTEDRTIKFIHDVKHRLESEVASEAPRELVERIVKPTESCFEEVLNFTYDTPSQTFKDVVLDMASRLERGVNKSALDCCRSTLVEHLPKETKELKELEQNRLDKAISFCHKLDFPVSDYDIIVSDWLGVGVMGLASSGKIYISTECFDMGTKYLASTLIEEYIHLAKGLMDETRELQTYLFNKIITLGEQLSGEML